MKSYLYVIPKEDKVFFGGCIDYKVTQEPFHVLEQSEWFRNLKENYTSQYGELIIVDEFTMREKVLAWENERYFNNPIESITEEQYDYFLNVLPPLNWNQGIPETFFIYEFLVGNITVQYGRYNNKFIRKNVRYGDRTTYIKLEDFLKVKHHENKHSKS